MSNNWPTVKLGDVLRRSEERVELRPEEEYRQITLKLWGKGAVLRGILTGAEVAAPRQTLAHGGQFILSRIDARNGALGIVPDELDGAIVSNDFPVFNLVGDRLLPLYFGWMCKTAAVVEKCQRASEGTTNRVRLQEDKFLAMEIPLPPLAEQRRIVARIEELGAKIGEARELRKQASEEAEALIVSAASACCQDDKSWTTVRDAVVKRKGAVRSGPFGSQLLHEEFVESGIAAIGTRDVQTNRFEFKSGWCVRPEKFEELRRYRVFPGDVLCTIVGASIGRFCVVPSDIPLAFTTKHIQALTLDMSAANPQFVSYMLNFHRRCRESLFSQVEGSAQPSLNAEKVLTTTLPLPSLPEQRRIVAHLDGLQKQTDALKALQAETSTELLALMPSILDKAFRGEL